MDYSNWTLYRLAFFQLESIRNGSLVYQTTFQQVLITYSFDCVLVLCKFLTYMLIDLTMMVTTTESVIRSLLKVGCWFSGWPGGSFFFFRLLVFEVVGWGIDIWDFGGFKVEVVGVDAAMVLDPRKVVFRQDTSNIAGF